MTSSPITTAAPTSPKPTEGRRERRKRELRQQIFDVALNLFMTRGFEATTVEQIAEAADIAPATFFNHFQNKQAVLVETTNEVVAHLQHLLDQEFGRDVSIRARLLGFADAAAADIEEVRGMAREVMLIFVRNEGSPGAPAPYLVRVHEPFANLIREGQAKHEVRSDQDADFLAEMVLGILSATVTGWLADSDYPIEKRLRQAAAFAWDAIQSPNSSKSSE